MNYYVTFELRDRLEQRKLKEGFNYEERPSSNELAAMELTLKARFRDLHSRGAQFIDVTITPNPSTEEESYVG